MEESKTTSGAPQLKKEVSKKAGISKEDFVEDEAFNQIDTTTKGPKKQTDRDLFNLDEESKDTPNKQ